MSTKHSTDPAAIPITCFAKNSQRAPISIKANPSFTELHFVIVLSTGKDYYYISLDAEAEQLPVER